jgi:hypothetical protein
MQFCCEFWPTLCLIRTLLASKPSMSVIGTKQLSLVASLTRPLFEPISDPPTRRSDVC